jgi:4-amino-4-deoxy-L-arabinose transferase-like glycosyltransferase
MRVARPSIVLPLALAGAGGFIALSIMAADRSWPWGIVVGSGAVVVAAVGVLRLAGGFDGPDDAVVKSVPLASLRRPIALVACAAVAMYAALALATTGRVGPVLAGLAVTSSFLALVAAAFRLAVELGALRTERDEARPLFRRHGFWVLACGALLYLPRLGSFSLVDPWESHYGEVARGILARQDWISTWTPQLQPVSGWFWSKPILDMWMQALAMAALGVDPAPGHMLLGAETGRTPAPEWAVRIPACLLSIVALYALYKAVARVFGRRAGLASSLVLATTSQWFFLSHQSMTDMPLVAALSISMALVLMALHTDPAAIAPSYEIAAGAARWRVGLREIVFGVIVTTVLAQALYLASRNIELQWIAAPHGFRWHPDVFWSGSKGSCGLPGNPLCQRQTPEHSLPPIAEAAGWLLLLFALLAVNRTERRTKRLYLIAAWYFAAVATLGKGPAGFALPAAVALAHLAATANWRELVEFEIPSGLLVLAVVALPWYVAMFVRHGQPFTDQLIFHHMWKRAFDHVHDMNSGDDVSFRYYVWQLGYGLFPWTGLLPAALAFGGARGESRAKNDALVFFGAWFVLAFGLFAAMPTKFHHYIFPAVPPAAMLVGIWVDRVLGMGAADEGPMLGAAAVGSAIVTLLVGRDLFAEGDMRGEARLLGLFTYNYAHPWPDSLDFRGTLELVTALIGALMLLLAVRPLRRRAAAALLAVALGYATWALDDYLPRCASHWGQREIFETYHRLRASPDEPIIGYRLNWLGEYFYSGNGLPAFGVEASAGASLPKFVQAQIEAGRTTFYFATEHGSVAGLRGELGQPRTFERLTDARTNNKFVLVRASFDSISAR